MATLFAAALLWAAAPAGTRAVSYDEIVAAMRESRGYNALATTNGPRFQAEVVERLVRKYQAQDPERRPLFIGHDEWFRGVLATAGIPADRAPPFIALAWRHEQGMLVDYRAERVVRQLRRGPALAFATNVTLSWPDRPGAAQRFSYEDTLSVPQLRVHNARVIRYRFLRLGDMVLFDEIEGLTGRPTTGALGLLFDIIGDGRVVEFRMALAPDGRQVSRGRARKAFIEVGSMVTVQPDGRAEKGVPDHPALRAIERVLEQPLEIEYHPYQ